MKKNETNQFRMRNTYSSLFLLGIFLLIFAPGKAGNDHLGGGDEGHIHNGDSATVCTCPYFTPESVEVVVCEYEDECLTFEERVRDWDFVLIHDRLLSELRIMLRGGEDPAHLTVEIVDINHQLMIPEQKMHTRELRLPSETLPPGFYQVHWRIYDQVIMRRVILIPYT